MFESKEILIMISSSFGTAYRTVYTSHINNIMKFVVSLIFSLLCGIILIYYCKEKTLAPSTAIALALMVGLLSHNLAQILINVGNNSQGRIVDIVSDKIEETLISAINSKSKKVETPVQKEEKKQVVKKVKPKNNKKEKDGDAGI